MEKTMAEINVFDLFKLDGRVALITGGSKGLGESMAHALAEAGAHVIVNSRTQADCDSVAANVQESTGVESIGIAADITQEGAVDDLYAKVIDHFGRLDIVINSAGINIRHPIEDFPFEEYKRVIDINLIGTWLSCRAAGRIMKPAAEGSVINVSSTLGAVGLEDRSAYTSSKSGVIGLTRSVAKEWAEHGVRCNALCPGPFLTEMNKPLLDQPERVGKLIRLTAMNRWAEMHEIKGAALFLASDASSYVTGSELYVDGGWTC
jgi:NAD(P)-dependent dehydrogenase (short-subunit alcohol dehydrogenase family)